MGLRFHKHIKILPGLWYNVSKKGGSWSVGGQGVTWNSKRGTTYSARGTGVSYAVPRHHEGRAADTLSQENTAQKTADRPKSIIGPFVLVALVSIIGPFVVIALGVCFLILISNMVNPTNTGITLTQAPTFSTPTVAGATPEGTATPLASRQIIRETEPHASDLDRDIAKIEESMQRSRSGKVDEAAKANVTALIAAAKTLKIEPTRRIFDRVKKDSASSYPGTDDNLWTYEDRWDYAVGEYFLNQSNENWLQLPNI